MRTFALPVGVIGFIGLLGGGVFWSVPAVEQDLTERADQAPRSEGLDEFSIRFDGRAGELTGVAPIERSQLADQRVSRVKSVRTVVDRTSPPTTHHPHRHQSASWRRCAANSTIRARPLF